MASIEKLLDIMRRLRNPDSGCPWDLRQDFASIAPYTIEEAYEVDDAIRSDDMNKLCDELGDLLFQVVFHSQLAKESGAFSFDDVVAAISDKLTRRHPHVFADASIGDAEAQTVAWEEHKANERAESGDVSALADVPLALPALARAQKLGKRASRVGFDWPNSDGPREKIAEELAELDDELKSGDHSRQQDEIGDLLFSIVNLSRHLGIDTETALRDANERFSRRFRVVESSAERPLANLTLDELETLWKRAKQAD